MKTNSLKHQIIIKGILLLWIVFCSFRGYGQTLNDYLIMATQNNPEIKASYLKFEAALQRVPQMKSWPDPTITISAFGRMIETRVGTQEARFSFMQMFPWFGTLEAKGNAANAKAEATFQNYLDTRNEVLFNVKRVYAEMYELEKMIQLEEENLEILNTYKELGMSKFKNGNGTMVDVVRIDIKRNESETNIKILKDNYKPLQIEFNTILNRNVNDMIVYPNELPLAVNNVQILTDSLFNSNPKLLMLEHEKLAFEAQKEAVIKDSYPKIGIGLDYSIISKRDVPDLAMNGQDAIMPMLSFTLPIFSRKYSAAKKEADYQIQATLEQKEAVKNNLVTTYSNAQYEISKSINLLTLFDNQINSTKQAVSLLITAYSNSNTDFDDILRMNQDLLMYEKAKATETKNLFIVQSKMEYLLSKSE